MQTLMSLRTTDGLDKRGLGIGKKWLAKDEARRKLMWDLTLKINYSIQDFNATIEGGFSGEPKDVIYLIVLADWIKRSYWQIKNCLRDDVSKGFEFSDSARLELSLDFLEAIRSFVVAHPEGTNKHPKYGFSGGRICVDVRTKSIMDDFPRAKLYRLYIEGIVEAESVRDDDVVLVTYSEDPNDGGGLHFQRVCFDMGDVRDVAQLYIDALYELDRYVSRLKKKDFE